MGIKEDIKNFFGRTGEKDNRDSKLLRNVIILGIIGLTLLFFGNSFLMDKSSVKPVVENDFPQIKPSSLSYDEKLAQEMEEIISLVKGVGKVRVKIYTAKGPVYEYAYDRSEINKVTNENDQNGGERKIEEDNQDIKMVILSDAAGSEKPIIKKEEYPSIEGVLVVAQGADVSTVKYKIVRAVSSLLDLPVHKISVLPYK